MKKIFLDVVELRRRAAENYLSQVELSKAAGLSYQRMNEIYRQGQEKTPIRETSLMKLARALQCMPSEITAKG